MVFKENRKAHLQVWRCSTATILGRKIVYSLPLIGVLTGIRHISDCLQAFGYRCSCLGLSALQTNKP